MAKKEYKSKGFLLFDEYEEYFKVLSPEDQGRVLMSAFAFFNRGEIINLDGMAQMLNLFIRDKITHSKESYQESCEKRAEGTKKYHDNLKSLQVTSSNSKNQTKTITKTKTEAKTSVLVSNNSASDPSPVGEWLGSSASTDKKDGQFTRMITGMLDNRDKGIPETETKREKRESDGYYQMTSQERWDYLEKEKQEEKLNVGSN